MNDIRTLACSWFNIESNIWFIYYWGTSWPVVINTCRSRNLPTSCQQWYMCEIPVVLHRKPRTWANGLRTSLAKKNPKLQGIDLTSLPRWGKHLSFCCSVLSWVWTGGKGIQPSPQNWTCMHPWKQHTSRAPMRTFCGIGTGIRAFNQTRRTLVDVGVFQPEHTRTYQQIPQVHLGGPPSPPT